MVSGEPAILMASPVPSMNRADSVVPGFAGTSDPLLAVHRIVLPVIFDSAGLRSLSSFSILRI